MFDVNRDLDDVKTCKEILYEIDNTKVESGPQGIRYGYLNLFARQGIYLWKKKYHPSGNGLRDRMMIIQEVKQCISRKEIFDYVK